MTILRMVMSMALVALCAAHAPAGDISLEVCGDVNESGTVSSTDALLVLKEAVGQPVALVCPAIDALAVCLNGDSCGDNVVNAVGEQCDGADLGGADCASLAFGFGTLACKGSCKFDATGCKACTGLVYEDTCWFLGVDGESCTEVCAGVGQVYDTATRKIAGSDGTDGDCEKLLDGLDAPGAGMGVPSFNCAVAAGCAEEGGFRGRCATPPTTSSAAFDDGARVCACTSECEGVAHAGACWFFGADGESCDEVCDGVGKVYSDATKAVAGSDGSDETCERLLDELGAPGTGLEFPSFDCGVASGCTEEGGLRGRCATPPTTSSASDPVGARVCACE
ncbi:MAG: hypothetical protein ABR538_16040 [Candidatus Binatia bacterium]